MKSLFAIFLFSPFLAYADWSCTTTDGYGHFASVGYGPAQVEAQNDALYRCQNYGDRPDRCRIVECRGKKGKGYISLPSTKPNRCDLLTTCVLGGWRYKYCVQQFGSGSNCH